MDFFNFSGQSLEDRAIENLLIRAFPTRTKESSIDLNLLPWIKFQAMPLQSVQIDLPSDILLTLNESEKELKERIQRSFAVHLYVTHKITIGKAAQVAQMTRYEFESFLSENLIPISSLNLDDILKDIDKLK